MIDVIGDVGGKPPVVRTVLEEISKWHRSVGEAMHKYCF